jgi:regulator of sigma D
MMKESKDERRKSSEDYIRDMLKERRELLSLLFQTSAMGAKVAKPEDILLEDFCQTLVDYIAAGHFSLYERITGKRERRQTVADQAMQAYPQIAQTTDIALQFNERYANGAEGMDRDILQQDLSQLAEALTLRMELEDRLINSMFGKIEIE